MSRTFTKAAKWLAALAALALGGAAIAAADSSHTSTQSSSSNTTSTQASSPSATQPYGGASTGAPNFPAPGTAAHEQHEHAITGANAEKAKAAALASVPGTAGEVTTDYSGNFYEVAVTRSDGSKVTVHLDSSFKVIAGPMGGAGGGGAGPGGAPGSGGAGSPPSAGGAAGQGYEGSAPPA
jgi:hypothetical protein